MSVYEVKRKDKSLGYKFIAFEMSIQEGGTLAFWSETKMILAINSGVWATARLVTEEEDSNV